MREINVSLITDEVKRLCIESNLSLSADMTECIFRMRECESSPLGKSAFQDMSDNIDAAERLGLPICQDTGMAVVFLEVGQDIHFTGGLLNDAVNEGVRRGYLDGFLRCSIVSDPLERVNTGDNTPAVIHTSIVAGDKVRITVSPKGFGSENMSAVRMFTPSATQRDIMDFIVDTVKKAGGNPCPPIVLGIGIGGDFELCAYLAKRALCRPVDIRNAKSLYSEMERELLSEINNLGIGPQGFGGNVTALAVNIEEYPTHIAGLPVAVNVGCHVTRHAEVVL